MKLLRTLEREYGRNDSRVSAFRESVQAFHAKYSLSEETPEQIIEFYSILKKYILLPEGYLNKFKTDSQKIESKSLSMKERVIERLKRLPDAEEKIAVSQLLRKRHIGSRLDRTPDNKLGQRVCFRCSGESELHLTRPKIR